MDANVRVPSFAVRVDKGGPMNCISRLKMAVFAAAVSGTAAIGVAEAQDRYPSQPIKFIVPYAVGGLTDTVARIVAQRLNERPGQAVVVENRPGGNGSVAASAISTAPADGYTFVVTDGSILSVNALLFKSLNYDPRKGFEPVALLSRAHLLLAHPSVPAKSLKSFVDYVRAMPGEVNYGSSGIGSTHHRSMEL